MNTQIILLQQLLAESRSKCDQAVVALQNIKK